MHGCGLRAMGVLGLRVWSLWSVGLALNFKLETLKQESKGTLKGNPRPYTLTLERNPKGSP